VRRLVQELELSAYPHYEQGAALADGETATERLPDGDDMGSPARFPGGAQQLATLLGEQLPAGSVHVGMCVTGLRQEADGISLETAGGAVFRARRAVVLALPPALLPGLHVHPPLPPPLLALCRQTPTFMAGCCKTVVTYAAPFWRQAGLSGAAFSRRGPLTEVHDHSSCDGSLAALLGFSAAPGPPDRDALVAQLVRLFGAQAAQPLAIHSLDWSSEEHTTPKGFSPPKGVAVAGGDAVFAAGAWDGRLQLCATETATRAGGPHIEGALAGAERAAAAVLGLGQ